jgi:hypothetical protein
MGRASTEASNFATKAEAFRTEPKGFAAASGTTYQTRQNETIIINKPANLLNASIYQELERVS